MEKGILVYLLKSGHKAGPGDNREITLLSNAGRPLCKVLNDRTGTKLEKGGNTSEGQPGLGQTVAA